MPSWLLQIIVTLAVKIGVPALLKYFPKLPPYILDIINKLLADLGNPKVSNSVAKKQALSKLRAEMRSCPGPSRTKKLS